MKKTIVFFIVMLVGIYGILTVLDKSDYKIQKRLWRVQKKFEEMSRDPKVVPARRYEHVVDEYRKIITKYPNSQLSQQLYLQIGIVYALAKDFEKSRQSFKEVLEKFPDNELLSAEALMNIGKTYETEGKEGESIATFQEIIKLYPHTDIGLNMPLYIANIHSAKKRTIEAKKSYREAVEFYKRIVDNNDPNSVLGFNAIRILASTYLAQKEWELAIRTFAEILLRYAKSPFLNEQRAEFLIKSINTVAVAELHDYDLPIEIYQKFIAANPDHLLNKFLEDVITGLKELKNQNVKINKKNQ